MKDHGRGGMPSPYPAAIPRRLLTITVAWAAALLGLVLGPLLLILALTADLLGRRPRWPTVRMVALVLRALWIETTSELRALWFWLSQPLARRTWTERNHELMQWWAGRLMKAAERVVGLRFEVEEPPELGPGPLIAFGQHVSIVDAVMPAYLLGTQRGWNLRYTLTAACASTPASTSSANASPTTSSPTGPAPTPRSWPSCAPW